MHGTMEPQRVMAAMCFVKHCCFAIRQESFYKCRGKRPAVGGPSLHFHVEQLESGCRSALSRSDSRPNGDMVCRK